MVKVKKITKLTKYLFLIGIASVITFVGGAKSKNNTDLPDHNFTQTPLVSSVYADIPGTDTDTGTGTGGEGCDGGCDGAP